MECCLPKAGRIIGSAALDGTSLNKKKKNKNKNTPVRAKTIMIHTTTKNKNNLLKTCGD